MKRIGLLLLIAMLFVEAFAQVSAGRSATTTMFDDFKPGVITFTSGRTSRQSQLNIFMRNSTLVFRRGKEVMEAIMEQIQSVEIEGRTFVNVGNALAEVVATDTLSQTRLIRIRTVDVEAMDAELKNNSTVDNLEFSSASSALSMSRRLDVVDEKPYPLIDTYYFVRANGKKTEAEERSVKETIGRKKRGELEHIVAYDFSWSSEASLIRLFPLFR